MATVLDLTTLGEIWHLRVDSDPGAGVGTPAPVGSMAQYEGVSDDGYMYLKYGVNDTDWDKILRLQDGNVKYGLEKRVALYFQDGYQVDDTYGTGNNSVFLTVTDPAGTRANPLHINFPDLGTGVEDVDVVLNRGDQSIYDNKTFVDDTTFNSNVLILGNIEVQGSLSYFNTTNTTVEDTLITINKGGLANSGSNTGFEIEENALITGFFKTTPDRLGYQFKAPGQTGIASLLMPLGNFSFTLPERTGTFLLGDGVSPTGNYAQIGFFSNLNELDSEAGSGANALTWDFSNNFLGIQQAAPKSILHVGNNTTSGTVGAGAIILGVLHSTNNVGQGAFIANGSGGANTTLGVDSAAFGAGNVSSALTTFVTGTNCQASANYAQAGGYGSIADGLYSFARGSRAKNGGFAGTLSLADSQDADSTNTKADQAKLRYTGGYRFNKGADYVDPNFEILQDSVITTNSTVTTLQSFTLPSDCVALVEARILGMRTSGTSGSVGDSASYVRTARIKSIAGVVTLDDLQSDYTSEDKKGWNGTIDVNSGNVRVRVGGAANTTVKWHCTTKVQILSQ